MVEEKEDLITTATKAAARLEAANKVTEELVKRLEATEARRVLGGQSEAGQVPPKPPEETPKQYRERVMSGKA